MNNLNFAHSEAQAVSTFVHYLLNERVDALPLDSKLRSRDNGIFSGDVVRWFCNDLV